MMHCFSCFGGNINSAFEDEVPKNSSTRIPLVPIPSSNKKLKNSNAAKMSFFIKFKGENTTVLSNILPIDKRESKLTGFVEKIDSLPGCSTSITAKLIVKVLFSLPSEDQCYLTFEFQAQGDCSSTSKNSEIAEATPLLPVEDAGGKDFDTESTEEQWNAFRTALSSCRNRRSRSRSRTPVRSSTPELKPLIEDSSLSSDSTIFKILGSVDLTEDERDEIQREVERMVCNFKLRKARMQPSTHSSIDFDEGGFYREDYSQGSDFEVPILETSLEELKALREALRAAPLAVGPSEEARNRLSIEDIAEADPEKFSRDELKNLAKWKIVESISESESLDLDDLIRQAEEVLAEDSE